MAKNNGIFSSKLQDDPSDVRSESYVDPSTQIKTRFVNGRSVYMDGNGKVLGDVNGPAAISDPRTSTNNSNNWNAYGTQNTGALMNGVYGNFDYGARDNTRKAIEQYMGLFDYDEAALRDKFNAATRAEYASKRAANQQAQAQYGRDVALAGTTLSDTLSKSLSNAVANGYSRGALAAQQQAAMLGLQETTAADAAALVQEQQQLAYDEAAALTKNTVEAEALAQSRIAQLAQNALNQYTADAAIEQAMYYGAASGLANAYSGVKGAQASFHDTDVNAQLAREESLMNAFDIATSNPANIINLPGGAAYIQECEANGTQPTAMGWLMSAVAGWDGSKLLGGSGGSYYGGGSGGGSYNYNDGTGTVNNSGNNAIREAAVHNANVDLDTLNTFITKANTAQNTNEGQQWLVAAETVLGDKQYAQALWKAVNKDHGVKIWQTNDGVIYTAMDPAWSALAGKSRDERAAYGDKLLSKNANTHTPTNLSTMMTLFGYSNVIVQDSKGVEHTRIDQARWENTLKYMEDYIFTLQGNTLVCTNKGFNLVAPLRGVYGL